MKLICYYLFILVYDILGFGIFVRFEYDYYFYENTCTSLTPGLTVKIHSADEIPNFFHDVFTTQSNGYNERSMFELRPKVMKISEGLAKVSPEK